MNPYAIQIELTQGCNLSCEFCGIHGLKRGFHFMTIETAERIAEMIYQSGWNSRIEFAVHGEPTMNPRYLEILKIIRAKLPNHQMMVLSNGGTIRNVDIPEILKVIDILGLELYAGREKHIAKIVGDHPFHRYPQEKDWTPHRRGNKGLVLIENIEEATHGGHSRLHNHCGCAFPLNHSQAGKRCAKPFRELTIRWDGNVAICCMDFRGVGKCGNIYEYGSLDELWNNEVFSAVRKYLLQGMRELPPCYGCDSISMRVGLLPDKYGRETLPLPTDADRAIWESAIAGEPYSEIQKRDWE